MNIFMKKIRGSFSFRLSLYILCASASVFILAFFSYFHSARKSVRAESVERAQVSMDNTILQIDQVLSSVETAVQNFSWLVADKLEQPDYMYVLTQQMLRSNPHVVGCAIAFEPSYYPEIGMMYSPYSYRDGERIHSKQLGTKDYDYHYMDWYQIPKLLSKAYWSEPYYDEGGADMVMTTYSYPLYDATGKMYAIFTADLSLDWFTNKVESIKPYPNSFNMMIGRSGKFLVHWDKECILNETVFATSQLVNGEELKELGHQMVAGERGMLSFGEGKTELTMFYAPVKSTGWSVAVACLHSDVFAGVDRLLNTIIAIGIFGLLLLAVFCYMTIKRQVIPLTRFAGSAKEIAQGNFTTSLPDISTRDEMKQLRDSFEHMQQSLVAYIDELKDTTAKKERIESELRIAREIQMGMVPKIFPAFPEREDVDLYAKLIPAKEVGGDLYDFFIEDNKLYFIVGDVSGKGVPASLVMAVTCRLFRTVASHFQTPAEIVTSLNDTLAENNESNMFCTFFLGILDLQTGHMQYCNAGHNAPVVMYASGKTAFLEVVPNLPLGLFEGFTYEDQECTLSKGDSLFLYTDGVTEAENMEKQLYSDEHLVDFLVMHRQERSSVLVENVFKDIVRHAADAEQSDDITIMCLNYK